MTAPTPTEPTTADQGGATPSHPAPTGDPKPPANGTPQNTDDEPLREPGKRALQQERERANALEKQLGELAGMDLGALKKVAEALGGKPTGDGTTDLQRLTDRITELESKAAEADLRAIRAEVATAKGLTPEQAAELRGSNRDELAAHADRLRALFTGPQTAAPPPAGVPRSDPSQGARPGVQPDPWNEGKARAQARYGNQQPQSPGS